jgi:putative serine protease PepD
MPRNRIAATVAAAALAGGGAGAGIVALVHQGGSSPTAAPAPATAPAPTSSVANTSSYTIGQIARQYAKSVVEIDSQQSQVSPFGGNGSASAEGTGFVYDTKGNIVTNAHVVDGASSLKVKFDDGSTMTATLVGEDMATDVAVIHVNVDASKLQPIPFGDSTTAQVGDPVVAIGNPFGLDDTVTSGIVSALHREITAPDNQTPIEDAIQTDAAINHGNSGGPLFNLHGQVIGITSQIQSDGGGNEGVGFAIPSNMVKTIADELIATGKAQHALLGVTPAAANGGVKIASVENGSGADSAGLKAGDVITKVDGTAVTSPQQLRAIISRHKPGDSISIEIRRGGDTKTVKATLGSRS